MTNYDIAKEIASRIKVGTPYTITNRERMRIWIEEALNEKKSK